MAAMASFPEVQKLAQKELDTVIGLEHRLPTLEDKPSLPYVTALMMECLRWQSVVPLDVPHMTTEDDEYRGYRIPKGSLVVANIWCVIKPLGRFVGLFPDWLEIRQYSHDPKNYPDPMLFKPERYLIDGELSTGNGIIDPADIAFGYGRR